MKCKIFIQYDQILNFDWYNRYTGEHEGIDKHCDGVWHTWTDKNNQDWAERCEYNNFKRRGRDEKR